MTPAPRFARFDRDALLAAAGPELEVLKTEARNAVRALKLLFAAALAFPVLMAVGLFAGFGPSLGILALVVVFVALLVAGLFFGIRIFKARSRVMQAVAPALGLSFAARADPPIDLSGFDGAYYGSAFKAARCEDVLSGERGGAAFQIFDAKVTARSRGPDGQWRAGRPPKWLEGFSFAAARVVRVEAPGRWTARTVLLKDAGLANPLQRPAGMERVRLVDPKFERVFEVYSTDQTEARAFLTPVVMERLLALENLFAPKTASSEDAPPPTVAVFVDGAFLVAMPVASFRDGVKPEGLLKPEQIDAMVVDLVLAEIDAVLGVVDAVAGPPESALRSP